MSGEKTEYPCFELKWGISGLDRRKVCRIEGDCGHLPT